LLAAVEQTQFIGKVVAGDMKRSALVSIFFALAVIFVYIMLRFDFSAAYGVGAVAALLHDVAIAVGAIVLANEMGMEIKIDLNVIAALLTIVGYSLNDTIVIYDRIRENRRALRGRPLAEVVDLSLNQTLARTILTSATTLLAVGMLFVFGGDVIRDLSFPLLVGVMVGTYSSIFVASPVMILWTRWEAARAQRRGGSARPGLARI
jgi:preprotein translocase SecF subunit